MDGGFRDQNDVGAGRRAHGAVSRENERADVATDDFCLVCDVWTVSSG
jgi:hypothetical protein